MSPLLARSISLDSTFYMGFPCTTDFTSFQNPSIALEGQRRTSQSLAKRKFTSDFCHSRYHVEATWKTQPALLGAGGQHEISPVVVLLREEHEFNPFPESLRGHNTGSHRRMTGLRSRDSSIPLSRPSDKITPPPRSALQYIFSSINFVEIFLCLHLERRYSIPYWILNKKNFGILQ